MYDLWWVYAIGFVGVVIYGSFFEWTLHRFVMHRPAPLVRYPYELHTLLHHRIFRADETYHAQNQEMLDHVTFTPRDYLILLLVNLPLFLAIELTTGFPLALSGSVAVLMYLGTFDALHWAFHVPKGRFFEKLGAYRWLKRHHLIHHRHHDRNLNVVLPIADLVLFTLTTRERVTAGEILEV